MHFKKHFLTLLLLLTTSIIVKSQLTVIPLTSNPVLEKYSKENLSLNKSSRALDTLSLPFFDDFAKYSYYPDNSLWIDQDIFVNQTYGDNPPSIGVATFDALDATGTIHSFITPHDIFLSDYLTSKPIDLANYVDTNPISIPTSELYYFHTADSTYKPADSLVYFVNGTPHNCATDPTTYHAGMEIDFIVSFFYVNVTDSLYTYNSISGLYEHIDILLNLTYSVSDSLYFSFYYQPEGNALNKAPESTDSLVLEFKNNIGEWIHVWSMPGTSNTPFKQVLIPIQDSSFVHDGFQFRFYNYVSIGDLIIDQESMLANNDLWNIDYITLAPNRNYKDTIPDDVTLVNNFITLLDYYTAVPWSHYKSTPNFQIDSLKFLYRNLSDSLKIAQRRYNITNKTNNTLIFDRTLGNENIAGLVDSVFIRKDTAKYFLSTNDDMATFEVKVSVKSGTAVTNTPYYWNDTLKFLQNFSNYYAYDDGTAEYGVGLTGLNTFGGKLAYKFHTLKPDTLRGVYMYFNRSFNDANKVYFYLAVWNSLNGRPNNLIYKQEGLLPELNGYNEFHYYLLDSAIFITDTFWVGWIQTTTDFLNIGVDNNTDESDKVFYNINGTWQGMPFPGSLMIRPIISSEPFVGISNIPIKKTILLYPNPVSDILYIDAPRDFTGQVYNITGKLVLEFDKNTQQLNVSGFPSGIYFMKGSDGKSIYTTKFIINR